VREVLTPRQVADYLQLSTEAVYRLIRRRQLAASRIGRSYRIPRADLDAFLIANSTRPEVQQAIFARLEEVARRHPDADGDALLAELERADAETARPVSA
jgi:excisionase family DNA binding protein